MKQVGKFRFEDNTLLNYYNIPQDENGWVDASKYHPVDYDLVDLDVKGKKVVSGWISNGNWMGLKLQLLDKVLKWRHQK